MLCNLKQNEPEPEFSNPLLVISMMQMEKYILHVENYRVFTIRLSLKFSNHNSSDLRS